MPYLTGGDPALYKWPPVYKRPCVHKHSQLVDIFFLQSKNDILQALTQVCLITMSSHEHTICKQWLTFVCAIQVTTMIAAGSQDVR